jgi:glycosyltransferase involved in cell wall biosynthesis
MTRPTLSIGCAVYNSNEKSLARSLDSVLSQTFKDFEVIVCDNSPDDKTRKLIEPYMQRDPRVRYYHNGVNLGAYPSFWRTFHIADGELFKWVADDDCLEPTYLQQCVDAMGADESIALCYTRSRIIHPDGSIKTEDTGDGIVAMQDHPAERFLAVLNHSWVALGFYGVFRASCLRRVHPVNDDCVRLADILLLAEISLMGRIEQIPRVLFTYTQKQKDWTDREKLNAAQYDACFAHQAHRGITFPNILFAHELMEAVRYSPLPLADKSRLYEIVPQLVAGRINGYWGQEVERAVKMVLTQRIFHNWGEAGREHAPGERWADVPGAYVFHAGDLLRRFEQVIAVWPQCPIPGLHSARAVLLALLNRAHEAQAALQVDLAKFPTFEPARKLMANLQSAAKQTA